MQLPSHQQTPAISADSTANRPPGRRDSNHELSVWLRFVCCVLGIGLFGLLVLARTLSPDPQGMGTHQQLGLPPCGFKLVLGIPCPSCGMTTSWALATRGQWPTSIQCNVGGFLLAMLAMPGCVWLFASGWRGNWILKRPEPWLVAGLLATPILAALLQWAIRIQLI